MNTLKGLPTPAEFNAALNEAKSIVEHHGWCDEYTYPYSYPIKIKVFLEWLEDYDNMTTASKQLARDELNGFIVHCINPWLSYESAPKVKIKTATGVMETTKDIADVIIEKGLGVLT